jgi:hypothetical protein
MPRPPQTILASRDVDSKLNRLSFALVHCAAVLRAFSIICILLCSVPSLHKRQPWSSERLTLPNAKAPLPSPHRRSYSTRTVASSTLGKTPSFPPSPCNVAFFSQLPKSKGLPTRFGAFFAPLLIVPLLAALGAKAPLLELPFPALPHCLLARR